jgi:polar amino acid transport system substrate-binding protein
MTRLSRRSLALSLAGGAAALALPRSARAETTLQRIRRTKKMTVGTEAAFPPFEFVKDGKIVGYGKDILDVIVADLGVEVTQLDLPWQGILPGVLAGKFDFVATSVGINPERAAKYAFTMPIASATPWFMKRKGDPMKALADLNGKVVGTQLASSTEPVGKEVDAALKAAGGRGFRDFKLYTAFPETYVALANGEIDAVVQSVPNLAVLIKERPGIFELMAPAVADTRWMAWVTRPDDLDLRDYISGVLKAMRDDGRLYALQDRWFGFKMEIPDGGYLPTGAV